VAILWKKKELLCRSVWLEFWLVAVLMSIAGCYCSHTDPNRESSEIRKIALLSVGLDTIPGRAIMHKMHSNSTFTILIPHLLRYFDFSHSPAKL